MELNLDVSARPMFIGKESAAFDDPHYLYELELHGVRCLAFLQPEGTLLQDVEGVDISGRWPELAGLHEAVRGPCVLDGVVAVVKGGLPDEEEIAGRRDLLPEQVALAAKRAPACFYAFDILAEGDRRVTELPLSRRKELLFEAVRQEGPDIELMREHYSDGLALMELALAQGYKSIVAKRLGSPYRMGVKSADWIRFTQ